MTVAFLVFLIWYFQVVVWCFLFMDVSGISILAVKRLIDPSRMGTTGIEN